MTVKIITTGLEELIRSNSHILDELNKEISKGINDAGNKTVRYAKQNHRFTSRTGFLENSITFEYKRSGNNHSAKIYLKDSVTSVDGGRSYGTFIHEGTYQGYRQSSIAPHYQHSKSKSGMGWKADPFLATAIEKVWDTETALIKAGNTIKKRHSA